MRGGRIQLGVAYQLPTVAGLITKETAPGGCGLYDVTGKALPG